MARGDLGSFSMCCRCYFSDMSSHTDRGSGRPVARVRLAKGPTGRRSGRADLTCFALPELVESGVILIYPLS